MPRPPPGEAGDIETADAGKADARPSSTAAAVPGNQEDTSANLPTVFPDKVLEGEAEAPGGEKQQGRQ